MGGSTVWIEKKHTFYSMYIYIVLIFLLHLETSTYSSWFNKIMILLGLVNLWGKVWGVSSGRCLSSPREQRKKKKHQWQQSSFQGLIMNYIFRFSAPHDVRHGDTIQHLVFLIMTLIITARERFLCEEKKKKSPGKKLSLLAEAFYLRFRVYIKYPSMPC